MSPCTQPRRKSCTVQSGLATAFRAGIIGARQPQHRCRVTETDKTQKAARQFINAIPHSAALGMQIDEMGSGKVRLSMPYDTRFVGDPSTGVIHGGAVSALLDTASGAAVMAHADAPGTTATITLRIDYLRAATPGQRISAVAECYHITRSVAFIRASAMDEDETRPVAMATGTFAVDNRKGGKP